MLSSRHSIIAVVLLALALYAVTLGGTFIYDDVGVLLSDERIKTPGSWGEYWTDSYNFGVDNLYRPLVSMTYAVQYRLHAETAWPYHLVNVLLHAAVSVAVAWFAATLAARCGTSRAGVIGFISGVLFAAHPVHVEAVANIVGRAELMCTLATIVAISLALSPLTRPRVIAIWLCCVIAILSKEQGLLAALMVGTVRYGSFSLWERAGVRADGSRDDLAAADTQDVMPLPQPSPRRRGSESSLLFALLMMNVAVIVFVRENVIGLKFWWSRSFLDPWIQPLADSVGIDRWLVPVTIVGRYFGLLVAPVTLRIDYGGVIVPGIFDARDPFFWLGVIASLTWLGAMAVAWLRRDRLVVIALLLFAIAYAPVSNLATLIGVNVAERLMYLPSVFFVIFIATLLARLPRRAMISVVSIVTLLFAVRTMTYAYRWNDRLAFYEYATRVEPRSMKAALLAMQEHVELGHLDQAEQFGRRATEIDPNYDDAWLRLAGVLMDKGAFEEARAAIERARAIRMSLRIGAYEKRLEERRQQSEKVIKPSSR